MVKNLPVMQETQVWSLVGKIPWRREWLPTPVFLPGEFHGQRSLAGYSPWGRKGSDTTEWLTLLLHATYIARHCSQHFMPFNSHINDHNNHAAAKSLQSCPTLCDTIDGGPPWATYYWQHPHVTTEKTEAQVDLVRSSNLLKAIQLISGRIET